tara:strand:- start:479 stop:760 length:282 start_codon:yes stop_codon:yes gene_type:complete
MEKTIQKIEKNGIYAIYGHADGIAKKGYAIVVLKIENDSVEGIRVGMDRPTNFKMSKDEFYKDMDENTLLFVEVLPKFVIKEMKGIYKINLKS